MSTEFTLTINDIASINVELVASSDFAEQGTRKDLYRIYIKKVVLMSTLNAGEDISREYQLRVTHPVQDGYTPSAETTFPIVDDQYIEFVGGSSPAGLMDGTYTYYKQGATYNDRFYLGQTEVSEAKVTLAYSFELETKAGEETFASVAVTDGSIDYSFEYPAESGTNKLINTQTAASADIAFQDVSGPVLYYAYDYTTRFAAPPDMVMIDQREYSAGRGNLFEEGTLGARVKTGNDFTLYVPNDDGDSSNGLTVTSECAVEVDPADENLFDLGLFPGKRTTMGTTDGVTTRNGLRGVPIQLYSFIQWGITKYATIHSFITTDSVEHIVSQYGSPSTTRSGFIYRGITYKVECVDVNGTVRNVSFDILAGQSTPSGSTALKAIKIRPCLQTPSLALTVFE